MGATGIRVSEIGFGSGDNAGLLVKGEPDVQLRAIERALELGINYFDTSPDYGKGLAEENIGKAMREIGFRPDARDQDRDHAGRARPHRGRRHRIAGRLAAPSCRWTTWTSCRSTTRPSIETDTTVPGWLHLGLDDYLGPGGALEGMERLRRAGKTRFFGFANEDADADAVLALMETGEFHMLNVWYDLPNPTAGLATPDGLDVQHDYGQFLRRAQELGIGTAVIRPLGGGVLTDHAVGGGGRHALAGGGLSRNADMYQAMVERARPFAFLSRSGQTLSQAAYRFILQDEAVTTVLGGFSEMAHLEEAVGCSGAPPITEEDMARLDMVWRSNVGKWDTEEQFISGL